MFNLVKRGIVLTVLMLWANVLATEDGTLIPIEGPKKGEKPCDSSETSDQKNNTSKGSGVWETLKQGLHSVKVSKYDATELERQFHGELFDSWEESFVKMVTRIRKENINGFLDHLLLAYEGIDEGMRKKMDIIVNSHGNHKVVDWNFSSGQLSGFRYGMLAFAKSPDGKYFDFCFVMHKVDFKIAPKVIVTKETDSFLFGLIESTTTTRHREETKLNQKKIKRWQNFFRVKAQETFFREGIIDEINYTDTLDKVSNDGDLVSKIRFRSIF